MTPAVVTRTVTGPVASTSFAQPDTLMPPSTPVAASKAPTGDRSATVTVMQLNTLSLPGPTFFATTQTFCGPGAVATTVLKPR